MGILFGAGSAGDLRLYGRGRAAREAVGWPLGGRTPGCKFGGREMSGVTDLQHRILPTTPFEHSHGVREHPVAATTAGILYIAGLAAIPLYVAAHLLAMYGVVDANSSAQTVLFIPLAGQEMVLAVWLIANGLDQEPKLPAATSRA